MEEWPGRLITWGSPSWVHLRGSRACRGRRPQRRRLRSWCGCWWQRRCRRPGASCSCQGSSRSLHIGYVWIKCSRDLRTQQIDRRGQKERTERQLFFRLHTVDRWLKSKISTRGGCCSGRSMLALARSPGAGGFVSHFGGRGGEGLGKRRKMVVEAEKIRRLRKLRN